MSNPPNPPAPLPAKRNPGEHFDPLGSYTGRPLDPNDKPQQDADDL